MKIDHLLIAAVAVILCILAESVGTERAKASQECYKAAQVNLNIKCDF